MYHLTEFKVHFRYTRMGLELSNCEIIKCVRAPLQKCEPFVANFCKSALLQTLPEKITQTSYL